MTISQRVYFIKSGCCYSSTSRYGLDSSHHYGSDRKNSNERFRFRRFMQIRIGSRIFHNFTVLSRSYCRWVILSIREEGSFKGDWTGMVIRINEGFKWISEHRPFWSTSARTENYWLTDDWSGQFYQLTCFAGFVWELKFIASVPYNCLSVSWLSLEIKEQKRFLWVGDWHPWSFTLLDGYIDIFFNYISQ